MSQSSGKRLFRVHTSTGLLALLGALLFLLGASGAQPAASLTYIDGSSVKLEQIIGDCDWQYLDYTTGKGSCKPTASQTVSRYHLLADGQASSFEDNGKLIFMCGDARSDSPNREFHAHDPIAYSTTKDPEAGLLLNFFTKGNGTPLFVEPPGIEMGGDDLPDAGISLPDGVYILVHTGHDPNLPDPKQNVYSVLAKFDETTLTFTTGRTVSKSATGGHFVTGALHASGTDVFMYGVSRYRASDIFLSRTPASGFWAGTGISTLPALSTSSRRGRIQSRALSRWCRTIRLTAPRGPMTIPRSATSP